jgi:hypothetical protein
VRWEAQTRGHHQCCFSQQSEHHACVLQGHHMRRLRGGPGMRT